MILYFTGTGNSRYLAEGIAKLTDDDELISINELIKTKSGGKFESDKPFVFVAPVYAGKIPRVMSEFIKNSEFIGSNHVYVIVNFGKLPCGTYGHAKEDFKEVGLEIKGFAGLKMPENYIALFEAPSIDQSNKLISNARDMIFEITDSIKKGDSFFIRSGKFYDKVLSSVLNPMFYKFILSSKGFRSLDNCNACGKCVRLCPLNCIELLGNKPKWDGECTHCMACICACPREAIEYKNNSKGKRRYYLKDEFKI